MSFTIFHPNVELRHFVSRKIQRNVQLQAQAICGFCGGTAVTSSQTLAAASGVNTYTVK